MENMEQINILNKEIEDQTQQIDELFYSIGEQYFDRFKDSDNIVFEEEMTEIKTLMAQIEAKKNQIMELRGLKSCPECRTLNSLKARFCMDCGHKFVLVQEDNTCSVCGSELMEGAKFCGICGNKVTAGVFKVETAEEPAFSFSDPEPAAEEPAFSFSDPEPVAEEPAFTFSDPEPAAEEPAFSFSDPEPAAEEPEVEEPLFAENLIEQEVPAVEMDAPEGVPAFTFNDPEPSIPEAKFDYEEPVQEEAVPSYEDEEEEPLFGGDEEDDDERTIYEPQNSFSNPVPEAAPGKKCPRCGNMASEDDMFCGNCGYNFAISW